MAADKYFELEIVCPDRVFFQGEASMIELNTTEGQVGIYKRHIPMTMILDPGLLIIKDDEGSGRRLSMRDLSKSFRIKSALWQRRQSGRMKSI